MKKSENTFLPDFSHIYVESEAKKYNLTHDCLDRFPNANIIIIENALIHQKLHFDDVFVVFFLTFLEKCYMNFLRLLFTGVHHWGEISRRL